MKYFPEYDPVITLKNSKILLTNDKTKQNIELSGLIKMKNNFSNYSIKENYYYNKNTFDISGNMDLTHAKVVFSKLNYVKESGKKSNLFFDVVA